MPVLPDAQCWTCLHCSEHLQMPTRSCSWHILMPRLPCPQHRAREAMQPLCAHVIPSISLSWLERDVSPWPSAMPNLCLRTWTSAATSRGREGIFQTMTSIPSQHQETPLPMSINYYINASIEPPLSLFNFLCYFGTGHSLISHLEHQKSYNYREEVRERALLPPYLSLDPSPLSPSIWALPLLPGLLYCGWLVQPGSCRSCIKTQHHHLCHPDPATCAQLSCPHTLSTLSLTWDMPQSLSMVLPLPDVSITSTLLVTPQNNIFPSIFSMLISWVTS